jgi:hypothetical protein
MHILLYIKIILTKAAKVRYYFSYD